jgi:hypothetical protein
MTTYHTAIRSLLVKSVTKPVPEGITVELQDLSVVLWQNDTHSIEIPFEMWLELKAAVEGLMDQEHIQ